MTIQKLSIFIFPMDIGWVNELLELLDFTPEHQDMKYMDGTSVSEK
jgi:hypothetical protein